MKKKKKKNPQTRLPPELSGPLGWPLTVTSQRADHTPKQLSIKAVPRFPPGQPSRPNKEEHCVDARPRASEGDHQREKTPTPPIVCSLPFGASGETRLGLTEVWSVGTGPPSTVSAATVPPALAPSAGRAKPLSLQLSVFLRPEAVFRG